jgi:hypothetical protein
MDTPSCLGAFTVVKISEPFHRQFRILWTQHDVSIDMKCNCGPPLGWTGCFLENLKS